MLVDINDVWSESTDASGQPVMVRNTLYIPEGKKPLIISYDDVNYYDYMIEDGFTYKLIIGDDGLIWSYGLDPQGNEVISQDLDAITILDKFVREHPDFSPFGAKGSLSLTGYQGILGYRTQNDIDIAADDPRPAPPLTPTVRRRSRPSSRSSSGSRRPAGPFGSHTWGHIRLDSRPLESVQRDTVRWAEEVGSLWAPPTSCSTPTAAAPTGTTGTPPARVPVSPEPGLPHLRQRGLNSFSYIKKDFRRHLRPAPPRRHHPAQRQGPGVVQPVLRRAGDH